MTMPPPKWKGFSTSRIELEPPRRAKPELAKPLGRIVKPIDLGTGPWNASLRCERGLALAWIEVDRKISPTTVPAGKTKPQKKVHRLLVARRVGLGWVIVSTIPQMNCTANDAVGATLLKETILWGFNQHRADLTNREQER